MGNLSITSPIKEINNLISCTGKRWIYNNFDEKKLFDLSHHYNLDKFLIQIILNRNINHDNIDKFINPKLKNLVTDPFKMLDMDKAVNRIYQAIINNEKIVIFGDYDVDGATSSALLKKYFQELGIEIDIYIPDRMLEGYGPNIKNMQTLAESGYKLCITVDCGITAFEQIDVANKFGMNVIIFDHHQSTDKFPNAIAIVNPNRFDELSEHKNLAAVGVCFLSLIALQKFLKDKNYFTEKNEPDLLKLLDLVAIGTVCDVMSITGLNRAFVKQGLKILQQGNNIGLNALLNVSGADAKNLSTYHLGFIIGPRINAGGRVGQSELGSKLLTTRDGLEAHEISQQLDLYNQERKSIEALIIEEAKILAELKKEKPLLLLAADKWHAGVIGIAASRIKDKYYKPTAIIAIENGIGKASARSINGVDIGKAILAAKKNGLLINGGGHAAAAGFTVEEKLIPDLENFLSEFILNDYLENQKPTLKIDHVISTNAINIDLYKKIQLLAPFGVGNPEPKFVILNAKIIKFNLLKEKHLQCFIFDETKDLTCRAMLFNAFESKLGETIVNNLFKSMHIACTLKLNDWQGQFSVDIFIEDIYTFNK